jgi:antitoxin VapB
LADRLDAIALRSAALPVRDNRSADEILGYDDNGAPS